MGAIIKEASVEGATVDKAVQALMHEENPENKVDELINEFIEAYPELGSTVWFYFSD